MKCFENCLECEDFNSGYKTCTKCKANMTLNKDGECTTVFHTLSFTFSFNFSKIIIISLYKIKKFKRLVPFHFMLYKIQMIKQ